MKVILKHDIKGTGKEGDIVDVSNGYARNFLLKQDIAIIADTVNLNELKIKKEAKQFKDDVKRKEANELAEKLNGETINIHAKAGINGKLFGSVTTKEIARKLNEKLGINVDKKKLTLNLEIKSFGCYSVNVKLTNDVEANFNVMVTEIIS